MCYRRGMNNDTPQEQPLPSPAVQAAYRALLRAMFPLETAQKRPTLRIVS